MKAKIQQGLDATGRWVRGVVRHSPQHHTGSIHSWAFAPYCEITQAEVRGSHTTTPSRPCGVPGCVLAKLRPRTSWEVYSTSQKPTNNHGEGESWQVWRRGSREM